MFAHDAEPIKFLLGIVTALLAFVAIGGCGDNTGRGPGAEEGGQLTTGPDLERADPDDVEVISAWAKALSRGDVEGAAALFALPSVAENGPAVIRIRNRRDAIAFNESLPCGAELVAAETAGDFTTATFRLLDRPGGGCGAGVGGAAATSFVIEAGEIAEWRRVGTDPDPNGTTT